jgi:hypothetical protein
VFLHPVGYAGHIMNSSVSQAREVDAAFFLLMWALCDFHKKHAGTNYAQLVFLHPVGFVGHVVYSGASGHKMSMHYFTCSGGLDAVSIRSVPRHVTPNLCFCILWDLRVT